MMNKPLIEEVDCKTADEFLDMLSPRGPYFRNYFEPRRIIYRGQKDARWSLRPSVFRGPTRFKYAEGWQSIEEPTNKQQIDL